MNRQTALHLAPQTGAAFVLRAGHVLRITDPKGKYIAELVAFGAEDAGVWLSSGRTFEYTTNISLRLGHVLYTNTSVAMLTILADTVGTHEFLSTRCSGALFRTLYGGPSEQPSGCNNRADQLAPFGMTPQLTSTTFDVCTNVDVLPSGELRIGPPLSRPGDYLELRAEMDLLVGVTAWSSEHANTDAVTPIEVAVWDAS